MQSSVSGSEYSPNWADCSLQIQAAFSLMNVKPERFDSSIIHQGVKKKKIVKLIPNIDSYQSTLSTLESFAYFYSNGLIFKYGEGKCFIYSMNTCCGPTMCKESSRQLG